MDILIFEEPRCTSEVIAQIMKKTHFNEYFVSEAIGFSCGIWILWENTNISLECLSVDEQIINVSV